MSVFLKQTCFPRQPLWHPAGDSSALACKDWRRSGFGAEREKRKVKKEEEVKAEKAVRRVSNMEVSSDVTVPGAGCLKTSPAMCNQIRGARKDTYLPTMETVTHLPEVKEGKCFFPFRYRDGIFYDCVQFKAKHKWCSLNETYEGYWKYCSEEDFAKCVFPFWYRRLIYWACTEDGDSFGKAWCSLTRNYNKDRVWKYCD